MRPFCLTALVLMGCTKPVPVTFSDASVALEPRLDADDAGWLTATKVDAWLRYHRQLLVKTDAGALERARRERAVRVDAGLSEEEVDGLEDVVSAIVTQRTLSKLTGNEALQQFEAATASLTSAQREKALKAMTDLKSKAQQGASFEAERATYGAEAVNAVLAREAEVTQTWESLLEAK